MDYWKAQPLLPESVTALLPALELIKVLTEKYAVLVANPPYMGRGNMNARLASYLDKNYPIAKQDLYAAFMQMMINRTQEKGRTAFITMESWMFLSSFEKLRNEIVGNYYISSLGHFGWHIIGIAFGTAMTVIEKNKDLGRKGEYSYLTIEDVDRDRNVPYVYPKIDNGRFSHVLQQNFKKIPGSPIGYWVSQKIFSRFAGNLALSDVVTPAQGVATSDNARFVRFWHEVNYGLIAFNASKKEDVFEREKEWVPYNKGGGYRKWYGNQQYLLAFDRVHYHLLLELGNHLPARHLYFKPSVSWGLITSAGKSFRYFPSGFIFDVAGMSIFANQDTTDLIYLLGALNTKLYSLFFDVINPTVNLQCGDVKRVVSPEGLDTFDTKHQNIVKKVDQNISISKQDWDAHETSWDFQQNELVAIDEEAYIRIYQEYGAFYGVQVDLATPDLDSLEWRYEVYKTKWETKFLQLHRNEEELNRQFIEIYDLADELTPDVPLEEVTILQQGEISIEKSPTE